MMNDVGDAPANLDLLAPEFHTDPHRFYAVLRESGDGVHFHEPTGSWMVLRHADVSAVLRDTKRFSSQWPGHVPGQQLPERVAEAMRQSMLFSDPPIHTRLRSLINRAFTVRAVEALRPGIERSTDELIEAMASGPPLIDFVERFAAPLPIDVIAELLGVPSGDRDRFAVWSDAAALVIAPQLPPGAREEALVHAGEFFSYLRSVVERRRASPGDDFLSRLVQAEVEGEQLTDHDVVSLAHLLLAAGNETTRSLLASCLAVLFDHPDQMARLLADPSLVPSMVEEVLRFEPSVPLTFRLATTDVTFGETTVPAGAPVLVCIAAGNRDPREYDDPDTFDITRDPNRHLSFIFGAHRCLGAPLARLEADIALRRLFDRFPGIGPGDEPGELRPDALTRGYATLPVRLS